MRDVARRCWSCEVIGTTINIMPSAIFSAIFPAIAATTLTTLSTVTTATTTTTTTTAVRCAFFTALNRFRF